MIDYEHFTIPFILTVDKVLAKIRNKTMRELPGGTLFPDTMKQYDDYTIREALHNCIAHQDYTLQQRISFVVTINCTMAMVAALFPVQSKMHWSIKVHNATIAMNVFARAW